MKTQKGIVLPPDLSKALKANALALAAFECMRPSCQRRYATWVEESKRLGTRERRVLRVAELALEWKERHDNRPGKRQVA